MITYRLRNFYNLLLLYKSALLCVLMRLIHCYKIKMVLLRNRWLNGGICIFAPPFAAGVAVQLSPRTCGRDRSIFGLRAELERQRTYGRPPRKASCRRGLPQPLLSDGPQDFKEPADLKNAWSYESIWSREATPECWSHIIKYNVVGAYGILNLCSLAGWSQFRLCR